MNISVIIPAYKNTSELVRNLTHNLRYLNGCEVIVVNDYPLEPLGSALSRFDHVTLLENERNLGFGPTVNNGVSRAKNPYVMLLNSDVLLNDTSYIQSLQLFKNHTKLFAVSFAQREKNGDIVGKNALYWKSGLLYHNRNPDNTAGITGWAEGGSCIVNRSSFLQLNGFDSLYSPFYWEDVDLSYRAWKSGYTVLFDPSVVVDHHHQSTIGKYFDADRVKQIDFRNQLLCIWKNINDKSLIIDHMLHLKPLILRQLFARDTNYIKGYWKALARLPQAIKSRQRYINSDREVLNHFHEI